jgi:hypothetical protein
LSKTTIPPALRHRISELDKHRCAYCQTQVIIVGSPLTVDHIIPEALGGLTEESNLCLACRPCNEYKGSQTHGIDPDTNEKVSLFNPRLQIWVEHFTWDNNAVFVIGLTSVGRATIASLQMNNDYIINSRRRWVAVGWHPPRS